MITREQAVKFSGYERLHYTGLIYQGSRPVGQATCNYSNKRGRVGLGNGPYEFRVTGMTKTWKTRDDWRVPIKHGLREHWYLDQDNAQLFHLAENCPETTRDEVLP
jgi:hypothetical protein